MKPILLSAAAAASLCACTTPERLRPDVEPWQPPSRLDEIAYINVLREAFVYPAPSAANRCHDGAGTGYFRPSLSQGLPEHGEAEESAGHAPAPAANSNAGDGVCTTYGADPGPARIRRYLDAGFGLSDLYCQRYFVIATQSRLRRRFARNAFTSVDSLVGTILSLATAGETAIGIVNAGFGAVDSTFQNMDDSFLVAADLENVRSLVQSAQDRYRADATVAANLPTNYPAARSMIERYAGICSFTGMRRLVNISVTAQTQQLDAQSPSARAAASAPTAPEAGAKPAPVAPAAPRPAAMVPVPPVNQR